MNFYKKTILYTIILFLSFIKVSAASKYKYFPRIDVNYKIGNERNLQRTELFVPIYQNKQSLLFADIRGWSDNNDTSEGNIGLGFRTMVDKKFILGGYGFYDLRNTKNNNKFHQATFGLEFLTKKYDFRANYYYTGQKRQKISDINSIILLSTSNSTQSIDVISRENVAEIRYNENTASSNIYNTANEVERITTITTNYNYNASLKSTSYELSLDGLDLEFGFSMAFYENLLFLRNNKFLKKAKPVLEDIKLYAGYYHFQNTNYGSDIKLDGYRLRGEYNFFTNNNNKILLELEYSNDNIRNDISFFGLKYSYSFGANNSKKLSKLERRMTAAIIRDLDIVTDQNIVPGAITNFANPVISDITISSQEVDRTVISEGYINTSEDIVSGEEAKRQKIIFVDNSVAVSGNGSSANPYNSLADAESNSAQYDIIYVKYGDGSRYKRNISGTILGNNVEDHITLKDNQQLFGSGKDLTIYDITGNSEHQGTGGIVVQGDSSNVTRITKIIAANNSKIQGLDISAEFVNTGGNRLTSGVIVINKENVIINNNNINNSNRAVYIAYNHLIDTDATDGIDDNYYQTVSTNINNNNINNNNTGIFVFGSLNAKFVSNISNNTLVGKSSVGNGVRVYLNGGGGDFEVNIDGNDISSFNNAVNFEDAGVANMDTIKSSISNNTLSGAIAVINLGGTSRGFETIDDVNIDLGGGNRGSVGNNSIIGNVNIEKNSLDNFSAKNNYWGQESGFNASSNLIGVGTTTNVSTTDYLAISPVTTTNLDTTNHLSASPF